jgi:ABC-2 type transport system ATP-binding protein
VTDESPIAADPAQPVDPIDHVVAWVQAPGAPDVHDGVARAAVPGATVDRAVPTTTISVDSRIVVDSVSKWFGDVVAVSDVSFAVAPGVTALLGPNGAGKSTILRLLCGLTTPSRGRVRVLGGDPRRDLDLAGRIGLVPQQETLFEGLSALEFVRFAAVMHGLPEPDLAARRALGVVELDDTERRPISGFSKGMRQRAKVAQALVHDPEVVVLDEPLTGLDPRQRLHLISLFQRLGSEGRCVLVSSHVLDEVERFGSRVLVMVQGRLAAEGDFHAIRDLMDDRPHRIRVRSEGARRIVTRLLDSGAVIGAQLDGDAVAVLDTVDAARFRREVAVVAGEEGVRLDEVSPLDDDLESVFRYLVER